MKTLEKIKAVLENTTLMVEAANSCDKAYAVGTGNPDWYAPFGIEKPEAIAINVAGVQAVVSGIGILAVLRGAGNVDDSVIEILDDIINDNLSKTEMSIMLRLANCAWGAGQAFRSDKGPLGRMSNMNVFDLLPEEEVAKDYHQIKAAALFLRKNI